MSDFTWKGDTASSKGVIVSEYPPIIRPEQRLESVVIPGRSGEVYLRQEVDTYNSYMKECICYLNPNANGTNLVTVAGWRSGSGTVIFGNETDYAYIARIAYQIPFEKILRGRPHQRFVVPFLVQPFKRKAVTEADIVVTVKNTVVNNPGTVPSRPKIKVEGSGDVTLMIGGRITTITSISTSITIDTEAGMALDDSGALNASYQVSGDWPMIGVGSNSVTWIGAVSKITITPRWRYL